MGLQTKSKKIVNKNKIILVTLAPNTHRTAEENLGIEYLASSLGNKGYQVEIIDAWLEDKTSDDVYNEIVNKVTPLFVGVSSYMTNMEASFEFAEKLKEYNNDLVLVGGGFGPTFHPEKTLNRGFDYIIRGEGEVSVCELAEALKSNIPLEEVNGLAYKNNQGKIIYNTIAPLIEDLDNFSFPNRDKIQHVFNKKSSVNMVTARGCTGNCSFCSVISFFRLCKGKAWRTRSIKNIVDEMQDLYNMGATYVKVVDDSFVDGIRDEKWCQEFADEIEKRKIKLKLRGQIRADVITDPILKNLKRAGFYSFACGIENGTETALVRMNKRATLEDNENALALFKKYSYLVQMGYILFDKYTTLDELNKNYKFLKRHDFVVTKGIFSEMYSAEGTRLNEELKNSGELIEGDTATNNGYSLVNDDTKLVYTGLKHWHKSHSEIYDMAIDPLTAPKAITDEAMQEFYKYALNLKENDLETFKVILDMVNSGNTTEEQIIKTVKNQISNKECYYKGVHSKISKLYIKNGIEYKANKNPFI